MRTQWPPEFGKRVPLWDAVYAQDAAAVQKLLATPRGVAQVNTPHGMWQQTSVHVAVAKGNSKILKTLLFTPNVNVDARTINGTTPLHLALESGRRDMVQDLLLVGANPLLMNYTGRTAINMADVKGLVDVRGLLLQYAESRPFQLALRQQQQQQQQPAATVSRVV